MGNNKYDKLYKIEGGRGFDIPYGSLRTIKLPNGRKMADMGDMVLYYPETDGSPEIVVVLVFNEDVTKIQMVRTNITEKDLDKGVADICYNDENNLFIIKHNPEHLKCTTVCPIFYDTRKMLPLEQFKEDYLLTCVFPIDLFTKAIERKYKFYGMDPLHILI